MNNAQLHEALEALYNRLNRREFVSPDPLEVVYRYDDPRDREVAGLIAACLAYGRVAQILRNLNVVLHALGPAPAARLRKDGAHTLDSIPEFRHRWTDAREMAAFLDGIAKALRRYGSLEACFLAHHAPGAEHTLPALTGFSQELRGGAPPNSLLSAPEKGSACKRLHLYLRWMVRCDEVDPGGWTGLSPAALLIPLDTHMHRLARGLRLTRRNQANLATVLEVTESFRRITPADPLKYDFALTRLGIRSELDPAEFLRECGVSAARVRALCGANRGITPRAATPPASSTPRKSPRR
jgi:uncharacterized protein (TIGR02757 family)